jgi:hypothetical protein
MLTRKLFLNQRFLWALVLVAMFLRSAGTPPVMAATCDRTSTMCEFDTQAVVSVSNLNVVCVSPNPITEGIQLTGNFAIRAHIILPPSPITPPSPIIPAGTTVTLHLDATRISGVGLMDGRLYQGSQGTNQNFVYPPSTMVFNSSFDLVPSQPTQTPPSPVCPTQVAFQVQLYATELGIPAISATLSTPE